MRAVARVRRTESPQLSAMTTPQRSTEQLRDDALRIWRAGVAGVAPARLMAEWVQVDGDWLVIGEEQFSLADMGRIAVVGGGKAGAAMATALEATLGDAVLRRAGLTGVMSVPADCVTATRCIELVAGRPPGVNEPRPEGVAAVQQMLQLVGELGPRDLCLCLLSGGGSALLPAPVPGFTLEDKIQLTQLLSAAGATIDQLNAVRRELSAIKGGGLARACRSGRLISLIISDVPGDDLATIASGPTVPRAATPQLAIDALHELGVTGEPVVGRALKLLADAVTAGPQTATTTNAQVANHIIGNNAVAVDAAGVEAERLGYSHAMTSAAKPEGPAEQVAADIVRMARDMRKTPGPDCLISGGEPTVTLAPPEIRGRGGRNQQLCLAALQATDDWRDMALVSGGTDGEDGPTDAAGALVDADVAAAAHRLKLDAADYLARSDAYSFFEQVGSLIKTGPTHTNVCDLRIVTVSQTAE